MKIKVLNQKLDIDFWAGLPTVDFYNEWNDLTTKELLELERMFGTSVSDIMARHTQYNTPYVAVEMNKPTIDLWKDYVIDDE